MRVVKIGTLFMLTAIHDSVEVANQEPGKTQGS